MRLFLYSQETAFDTLGLSSIASFDGAIPSDVYTITEEVATNNPDLGLSAGTSYALSRTAAGEWEMLPVNVSDQSNIFLTGDAPISFTAKKTAFDTLGLSSIASFDGAIPSDVYTITEEVATNNPDLGLSAGIISFFQDSDW